MKLVEINPVTRLEGEAKISIILDDDGSVRDAYFQIVEFRGFEKFCVGRPVEELPRIVTRICGVCPWAHHMASAKAADMLFGREPTETAKKVRELGYCAHILDSHSVHFYALAAPDFIMGFDADRPTRNIIGMLRKNPELVKKVLKMRSYMTEIENIIGGKAIHPVTAIPGGISKKLSIEDKNKIEEMAKELLKFSIESVELFTKNILGNGKYKDLILGDTYYLETYYAGLVDDQNRLNFYDGKIRVMDPSGKEFIKFEAKDYHKYIAERVLEWSYSKFPYLRGIGWKFEDGKNSGIYRVGPLGRLNASDRLATEKAQEFFEEFREIYGKPAHHTMAFHHARLIEMVYAAERMLELLADPEIISDDIINLEGEITGIGIGVVEAPRGLLFHHYESDSRGIATKVNIIIPTTQNNPAICLDIKRSAQKIIKNGKINDAILNMVEMTFRAYDPCLACSTHSIPGGLKVFVCVYDNDGNLLGEIRR